MQALPELFTHRLELPDGHADCVGEPVAEELSPPPDEAPEAGYDQDEEASESDT